MSFRGLANGIVKAIDGTIQYSCTYEVHGQSRWSRSGRSRMTKRSTLK